jgi:hypothetical protein
MSASSPKACAEKLTLLAEYKRTTQYLADAVAELDQRLACSARSNYDTMYGISETARKNAVIAHEALKKHTAKHGC